MTHGTLTKSLLPIWLSAYRIATSVKSKSASVGRTSGSGRRQMLLHLDPEVIKGLKKAAVDLDTTASALVEKLLVPWLKRHEAKRTAGKASAAGETD